MTLWSCSCESFPIYLYVTHVIDPHGFDLGLFDCAVYGKIYVIAVTLVYLFRFLVIIRRILDECWLAYNSCYVVFSGSSELVFPSAHTIFPTYATARAVVLDRKGATQIHPNNKYQLVNEHTHKKKLPKTKLYRDSHQSNPILRDTEFSVNGRKFNLFSIKYYSNNSK